MSVKWKSRGQYDVASRGVDQPVVEIDDSRPLELSTVDEAVEKIGFGVFQIIVLSFCGLVWVRLCASSKPPVCGWGEGVGECVDGCVCVEF